MWMRARYIIDDYEVNRVEPKDRNIAMVFQSYALYPAMTVRDNVIFGLKQRKVSKDADRKIPPAFFTNASDR